MTSLTLVVVLYRIWLRSFSEVIFNSKVWSLQSFARKLSVKTDTLRAELWRLVDGFDAMDSTRWPSKNRTFSSEQTSIRLNLLHFYLPQSSYCAARCWRSLQERTEWYHELHLNDVKLAKFSWVNCRAYMIWMRCFGFWAHGTSFPSSAARFHFTPSVTECKSWSRQGSWPLQEES